MTTTVYQNPWFQVQKDGRYHYVTETNSDQAAVILPILAGRIGLLEMRRPAQLHELTLEIPRGGAVVGETGIECAIRELEEETGIVAASDQIKVIGAVRPNTAILASRIQVYVALLPNGTVPTVSRDDEAVGFRWVALSDVNNLICDGMLEDGFSLSALSIFNAWQAKNNQTTNA